MADRLHEILVLAEGGDEDVLLQIRSEIALMPESREQRMIEAARHAEEYLETIVPEAEAVDSTTLDRLAEDADF